MKHIENPNLPKGRVVLAAINSEAHDAIANLNSMGIKTINVKCTLNVKYIYLYSYLLFHLLNEIQTALIRVY